jgi:RNA ligase
MNSIEELQALVVAGVRDFKPYGDVYVKEHEGLLLFNYNARAMYENRWNWFERVSRGLILNAATGEVVARPFDKFFNWYPQLPYTQQDIVAVTEKMDGTLGILYRHQGEYRIATRGGFTGEQALWATQHLQSHHNLEGLPDDLTLMFEVIYPENRVVVDYGDQAELILLAARNRFSGAYLTIDKVYSLAVKYGFGFPVLYNPQHSPQWFAESAAQLDVNIEGYVIEMTDGTRWKIKGDRYRNLHKLLTEITFNSVLACVQDGSIDDVYAIVPKAWHPQIRAWEQEIRRKFRDTERTLHQWFFNAPRHDRKAFALHVQRYTPKSLHPYFFALLDGKSIDDMIYRHAFKDRADGNKPLIFAEE